MVKYLGKFCFMICVLSACKVPDSNQQSDGKGGVNLYRTDTVSIRESENAHMEVGLRNVSTGKKHGLWHYYDGDGHLVRIESFKDGLQKGLIAGFLTYKGKTSIRSLAYAEESEGEFTGPEVYFNADSTINFYNYYVNGKSVKSLLIDGEGYVEIGVKDTTYQIGRITVDTIK